MALTAEQIEKLKDIANNSTNEVARNTAKKKLEAEGISFEDNDKPEHKEDKPKAEPKEKKSKPAKKESKPKKEKPAKKEEETFEVDGKKYSKEDCEELYKGFEAKMKQKREATKKAENKTTATKVTDKVEVIAKQVMDDPKVQAAMERKPAETNKKITAFKSAIKTLFKSIEALIGTKVSESKMERIMAILEEED